MRIHYQWHCPFCDKVLESRKQFQKHKKEYHYKLKVKNTYIKICYCQYCNETFDTRQKLYEHLKICEEKIKLKINEKLEKHKVYVNRYELNGILKDELDRYNYKKFPEKIWIERKEKILNCGVDLMKFGWVEKVIKNTGYTKRIIEGTLEHFKDEFKGKYFRRKLPLK